jgi:hypothetical protein
MSISPSGIMHVLINAGVRISMKKGGFLEKPLDKLNLRVKLYN